MLVTVVVLYISFVGTASEVDVQEHGRVGPTLPWTWGIDPPTLEQIEELSNNFHSTLENKT